MVFYYQVFKYIFDDIIVGTILFSLGLFSSNILLNNDFGFKLN